MDQTEQPTLFGAPETTPADERHRPWHYILVSRLVDYDDDDEETGVDYVGEGYDDLDAAREEVLDAFEEDGVWDNWVGVWVVEPEWSDEVEMTAEGSAPYSARPAAA